MLNLKVIFNNLDDFYMECLNIDKEKGDKRRMKELHESSSDFLGLTVDEILKSKYEYKKGLELLNEKLKIDFQIGGSKRKKVWSETDGDDMDIERFKDALPFLIQRKPNDGDNNGKFITLKVVISENCNVSYQSMLNKAATAVKITDELENLGYRVAILACVYAEHPGTLEEKDIDTISMEIPIKKFEEPLIKSTLVTCLSPWFFRYWCLSFFCAKFVPSWGMGRSICIEEEVKKNEIIINMGDCLNERTAKEKIKELEKQFNLTDLK